MVPTGHREQPRFKPAAVALALGLTACAQQPSPISEVPPPAPEQLQVVATSSLLCDLSQQVAADTIDLICLMPAGQDPHTFRASPSDRQAIDAADLVLYGGYDSAPALEKLVTNSPNGAPKIAVYEVAVPNPLRGSSQAHHHDHEHPPGAETSPTADPHPEPTEADTPDPHVWHNAAHVAALVEVVADQLAALQPSQAENYSTSSTRLADQFRNLHGWIETQVATVPPNRRKLITPHDSFRYFADAYGLSVAGALSGVSTDAKPAAAQLTRLVDQVKAAQVPAIFAETTTNLDLITTVANDAGVIVAAQPLFVEGPGGPDTAAPTTQAMLVVNTCTIVNALGGTCTEDTAPL